MKDLEASFPSERFEEIFTPTIAKNLLEVGFAVVDNVFGKEWTDAFRHEIRRLHELKKLYSNATYYEGKMEGGKFSYAYSISKPNVHELDLLNPESRKEIPHLDQLFHDQSMMCHMNSLIPDLNLDNMDVKVQLNSGNGACFPMHFDTAQQVSKRQITGTLYLNPDWKEEDGGQLRVYPFPYQQVDIEPKNDRLVLFSSHQTLHRVLPSYAKERFCITLWFESSCPQVKFPTFSWLRSVEGIGFVLNPTNRKALAKYVYADEWAQSVVQGFGDQPDVQKVLASHRKDVETIKAQLGIEVLSFVQECLPLSKEEENFRKHVYLP